MSRMGLLIAVLILTISCNKSIDSSSMVLLEGTWKLRGNRIDSLYTVKYTKEDSAGGYFRLVAWSSALPDTFQKDRIELYFGSKPNKNAKYKIVQMPMPLSFLQLQPDQVAMVVTDHLHNDLWRSTGVANNYTWAAAPDASIRFIDGKLKVDLLPNTLYKRMPTDSAGLQGSIRELN